MIELHEANLAFRKSIAPILLKCGLKEGNHKILRYVSEHPGCLQKEIAENCFVDTSTLTTVLSNMERKDLIKRERLANNNRAYSINVTPHGKAVLDSIKEQYDTMVDTALSGFSQNEADELISYLNRMTENLRNAGRN